MGDDDALYVKPDLADAIAAELVSIADVLLPNIFELARLTGRTVKDGAAALEAAQALQRSSGVKVLVATGIPADRPDRIAALALAGKSVHRAEAPRRKLRVSGTGDTFSALYQRQLRADARCRRGARFRDGRDGRHLRRYRSGRRRRTDDRADAGKVGFARSQKSENRSQKIAAGQIACTTVSDFCLLTSGLRCRLPAQVIAGQFLGDLHRVERGAFAQVVGDASRARGRSRRSGPRGCG